MKERTDNRYTMCLYEHFRKHKRFDKQGHHGEYRMMYVDTRDYWKEQVIKSGCNKDDLSDIYDKKNHYIRIDGDTYHVFKGVREVVKDIKKNLDDDEKNPYLYEEFEQFSKLDYRLIASLGNRYNLYKPEAEDARKYLEEINWYAD